MLRSLKKAYDKGLYGLLVISPGLLTGVQDVKPSCSILRVIFSGSGFPPAA